jgi:hypothetical protein
MSNRIPRKFNCIKAKILIDTNVSKANDELHIYKNDYGYLSLNKRTNEYSYMFVSMMRNDEIFEILEIN